MKITISGSVKKLSELENIGNKLGELGFAVYVPERSSYQIGDYETRRKLEDRHLSHLKDSDALLIGNIKEASQKYGRVGTSTYFEAGWAYALGKRIYALEPIDPGSDFAEDLLSLDVVQLNGDLSKMMEEK
ncbi:MAG: nucleoside 2-deoxyribosyltransferase [Candidatus Nomurabacteria bacterium]|jgi:nucleoside 2-deoxyribosyltransferase|nr:nucleoside 2-deoxyribosyltransferase [Candidatus Nomurabacteria bacterium]